MNKQSLKLLGAIAIGALIGAGPAQAQDKATLDLLVKKGIITQTDADQVVNAGKAAPLAVSAKGADTVKITLGGYVQAGYAWTRVHRHNGAGTSDNQGFSMNRVVLEINADLGNGWSVFANPEFDNSRKDHNYLDAAGIRWDSQEYGVATVGLQKVTFGVEEYTHPTQSKTINNSVLTNYFVGGLGFASRHLGAYWAGSMDDVDGFTYGLAVTNSQQEQDGAFDSNNKPAVWANAAYTTADKKAKGAKPYCGPGGDKATTCEAGDCSGWELTVGLNLGWQRDNGANATTDAREIFGYNPYVKLANGPLAITGEMIGAYVSREGHRRALPFGFNASIAYAVNEYVEPVIRASWVDAWGTHGISPSQMPDMDDDLGEGYDAAWSVYVGSNFHLSPSVTLGLGYEFGRYRDGNNGVEHTNSHAVRAQLQAVF